MFDSLTGQMLTKQVIVLASERISEVARQNEIEVNWYRHDGYPVAVVRFHWKGESEVVADGKKSSTNLHILMNWQKQGTDWKLLSRAATKLG
jgi:hypothetical protein